MAALSVFEVMLARSRPYEPMPIAAPRSRAVALPMNTPQDPAVRLLRAVAEQADRTAFAELFGLFAPKVKSYLLRLGLPAARAEELAQETMLVVWRRAAQFDPASTGAAAWIFTIARNLRIDAARRDGIAVPEPDPTDDPPPPAQADALVEAARQSDRIRAALAQLSAEQAEVVQLAFFDDRPHGEIERALGIPLGTVKSRLRLAMARLRALLGEAP
jgi:RNA polymerase sigma-70 factor (ECF subfamily)